MQEMLLSGIQAQVIKKRQTWLFGGKGILCNNLSQKDDVMAC